MLSKFCVGGVSLHRRSSRDNIFIKQFVFHSLKYSILKFSRRNPDFLFLNFSQNSYFHFLQMSRNQIIIPLFMNHSNVTIRNHILSNQKSVLTDQWEWPLLANFSGYKLYRFLENSSRPLTEYGWVFPKTVRLITRYSKTVKAVTKFAWMSFPKIRLAQDPKIEISKKMDEISKKSVWPGELKVWKNWKCFSWICQ